MADDIIDLQALQNKVNPKMVFTIIIIILVMIVGYTSFYIVEQEEEAVVLRFGKFNRTESPGLHFKIPFGVEKNLNVPTQRILKEEFGYRTEVPGVKSTFSSGDYSSESVMLTGDLNIADVTWIIQYKIKDAKAWLFNVEDQNKTIRDISPSVVNMLVGDLAVFDVVTTERSRIEDDSKVLMNTFFTRYNMGINVETVKLQKTMYPQGAVQDAFEDVNKAIQDRIRLINEGKEAYNQAIPKARGEAERTIRESEGYAMEKVNLAKGDVSRFLAVFGEYKKNPKITRTRLYYEMFEALFEKAEGTELIDKQLKNFIPFKSLNNDKGGEK